MSATATAPQNHGTVSLVPPAVYMAADIARLLQCCERSVWNLDASGILPGKVRINRLVRWRAKAVDEWIESGCPRPRGR
jgi:predicted DNA-binding transcriptional regulator AlpA